MIPGKHSESDAALSEVVSVTLIILLVVTLVGITASVLLGYTDILKPHTFAATWAEAVPLTLNTTSGLPDAECIGLFLKGGDGMYFGKGGTARITVTDQNGTVHSTCPEQDPLDWKPGDTIFISQNGTRYVLGTEKSPACDSLSSGLWQVAIVDNRSNILIAKHGVTISGSGDVPPVLGKGFTVEAWVRWINKSSSPARDEQWATIVVDGTNDGNRRYHLQHSQDNKRFEYAIQTGTGSWIGSYVQSTTEPQQGVWYYVVGVYNQTAPSLNLYVNGVDVSENRNNRPGTDGLTASSGHYQVGGPEGVTYEAGGHGSLEEHQRIFNGEIRGLRTWEGSMAPAEILSCYKKGLPAA